MSSQKKLAVIGNPIDHSLSPKIHTIFAEKLDLDISYEAINIQQEDFESSVRSLFEDGYVGLNITLPLKELAFSYANNLSEESELCGSVNTLWQEDSSVFGDTTDGRGLVIDLKNKKIDLNEKEVVILGAGGSAKAIIPSLMGQSPKRITLGNRTLSKAELLSERFSQSNNQLNVMSMSHTLDFRPDVIINTTSAGVLDQAIELPQNIFSKDTCVYDLSYSALETPFIKLAKKFGTEVCFDGIGMLVEQAALSFEIWTKQKPDTNLNKTDLL